MKAYIIEPLDPIIVRDGKPFNNNGALRASSMVFPMPSTTTGALRTRIGLVNKKKFDSEYVKYLKSISVQGSLLVSLNESGEINFFCPAPADVVIFDDQSTEKEMVVLKPLVPLKIPDSVSFNKIRESGMNIVGFSGNDASKKPSKRAPVFWGWDIYCSWLESTENVSSRPVPIENIGIGRLNESLRTHVKIDYKTKAAENSQLFETKGLEFIRNDKKKLALILFADSETNLDGFSGFGGERRIVRWISAESEKPKCPDEIIDRVKKTKACRLILLTPAFFDNGFVPCPDKLGQSILTISVCGACVKRASVVSGWDMETRKPKPTRRLAPFGSVYFLKFGEKSTDDQIESWISRIWFNCISDNEQDRTDGFGLAVIGTWSGVLEMTGSD